MRGLKKKRFAFRDETNIAGGFATPMRPALGSRESVPCRYLLTVRDLTPALAQAPLLRHVCCSNA